MHTSVENRIEGARGCGYRKPGGLYLVADGPSVLCGKLPIPLTVCPTCRAGIHPTRGWTWVDGTKLSKKAACKANPCLPSCPLSRPPGRVGLLWIGSVFYREATDWTKEAVRLGVSRRISKVPKDFVLGETWVWVAHRRAVIDVCPKGCKLDFNARPCKKCGGRGLTYRPGVFHAFKPTRIEYVVAEGDSDEKIERAIARGFTPVRVVRDRELTPLFD